MSSVTMRDPEPVQQFRSTASQTTASPTRTSTSLVASPQYMHQYRTLMDHQRQVFEEERALWHTERSEMQEKIARLEASLDRSQATSSSHVSSPGGPNGSGTSSSWNPGHHNGLAKPFTGEEFWRGPGGKNDAQPTRTFTNLADQSLKVGDRLPIIVENSKVYTAEAVSFSTDADSRSLSKASTRGIGTDKNLDGITFRKTTVPTITESLITSQDPLPHQSPSPTRVSSGSILTPVSLSMAPPDPYTKDAGHTPLARRSEYSLNGGQDARSGESATPPRLELERPPLEPRASAVRMSLERADSYFPPIEGDNDGDTELKEPLGIKDNDVANDEFLNMVDSRLRQVAQSTTLGPSESDKENIDEGKSFDQPEPEPKLRIKRSMNFGSQFGASSCGKGF
ncbi:hypothetical protein MMC07_009474 [Pseudocyphellaria aurata]|nr:hypothetical protein [Pseudocyphellaria aurata]